MCEGGSPGGGSGDMTSDVTAVTADGATSGAPCVRPGRSQAVCARGERYGSPARAPHRRRDVCARVRTYGLTDVIDPGGNTVNYRISPGSKPAAHAGAAPAVSSSNTRDLTRHSVVSSHGTSASKARLIGRRLPVPSSGFDPYIAGHRFTEATRGSVHGGGAGQSIHPCLQRLALDEVARGAPTGCVGRRLRVYPAAGVS